MNAIEVRNISKMYKLYDKSVDRLKESLSPFKKKYHKEFYALNNISFDIKKGQSVGIIGTNGAGKSTLLKIITGVLTPTQGVVNINGKVSALLELGTGFNPDYTGIENVYINGLMMGHNRDEMNKKLDSILAFADIGDFVYQPVKTYSSGMFVRLAFAVAINVDPEILIVDEALAVGDARFQIKCMDKFKEFRNSEKTILFVSHDTNSVKKFCDHAIWLEYGKIQMIGDADFVTDQYVDYLRTSDSIEISAQQEQHKQKVYNGIGWIDNVSILDYKGKETSSVEHGHKVSIKVNYYINDESLKDIVVGIAIFRIDGLYVCGLNTMLDNEKVKWKKGNNTIILEYNSFNLTGGNYYLDVALFEQTAHVPLEYRSKIKTFFVNMPYIGEGIAILDHKWNCEGIQNEV